MNTYKSTQFIAIVVVVANRQVHFGHAVGIGVTREGGGEGEERGRGGGGEGEERERRGGGEGEERGEGRSIEEGKEEGEGGERRGKKKWEEKRRRERNEGWGKAKEVGLGKSVK